jgi:antibiotic biosynthesis monooxygenase (ABM) superfamily enzyme
MMINNLSLTYESAGSIVIGMAPKHSQTPSRPPRWLAPVVMTLGAWLVAWLVVAGLLTYFGKQLASLPLGVRALVMSGLLVALMVNLVMPVLGAGLARLLARPPRPRLPRREARRPLPD